MGRSNGVMPRVSLCRLLQSHPQRVALPRLFSSIREGGTIAMQDMSIADRREREAVQRGALERLRGHGMPLPDEGESVVHLNPKGKPISDDYHAEVSEAAIQHHI